MQCAAVSTCTSDINVPAQKGDLLPGVIKDTCHGCEDNSFVSPYSESISKTTSKMEVILKN